MVVGGGPDANAALTVDIGKVSIETIDGSVLRRLAKFEVVSTVVFDGAEVPHKGGLHDPQMGPMDDRSMCAVCGGMKDCPGHLGRIELKVPVFHPLLITQLLRLLKGVCFKCRRLRLHPGAQAFFINKFEMVALGELELAERLDRAYDKLKKRPSRGEEKLSQTPGLDPQTEIRLIVTDFLKRKEERQRNSPVGDLPTMISSNAGMQEMWRRVQSSALEEIARAGACHLCHSPSIVSFRKDKLDQFIDAKWFADMANAESLGIPSQGLSSIVLELCSSKVTNDQNTNQLEGVFEAELAEMLQAMAKDDSFADSRSLAPPSDDEDEEDKSHIELQAESVEGVIQFAKGGKRWKSEKLQAYQILPILHDVFQSHDQKLIEYMYPMTRRGGVLAFFLCSMAVSANKFRPLAKGNAFGGGGGEKSGGAVLHPRTAALLDVLKENEKVEFAINALRSSEGLDVMTIPQGLDNGKKEDLIASHKTSFKYLHEYSRSLQEKVCAYMDNTKTSQQGAPQAIRQWMEKKAGAIRQKMMGKRVNYAARTTLTPDCFINTNEMGMPVEFAKKVTKPEVVTPMNLKWVCSLIENGPDEYPGAVSYEDEAGRQFKLRGNRDARRAVAKHISESVIQNMVMKNKKTGGGSIRVMRHLIDGDACIMNRQPSLHRPSMMAHFIRVFKGHRTFRMNYVNCGSYNADFDGDEMNMHILQSPQAAAEAALIANCDCQYTVPKSGEPLRGLIQDHVLGANFLTNRNTFITKDVYQKLIYIGVGAFVNMGMQINLTTGAVSNVASGVCAGDPYARRLGRENIKVVMSPPTIWKPEPLWTGKQVITAVLKTVVDSVAHSLFGRDGLGNIDQGFVKAYKGINIFSKSKTAANAWNGLLKDPDKSEGEVIIRDSELLQGVFDKSQFGASKFGLVHLMNELMGPRVAGMLLSVFQRIFTAFLQMRGFSCGAGDFLMTGDGEEKRRRLISRVTMAGNYLQEAFVDSVYLTMRWNERLENIFGIQSKVSRATNVLGTLMSETGRGGTRWNLSREVLQRQVNKQVLLDQINICSSKTEDTPAVVEEIDRDATKDNHKIGKTVTFAESKLDVARKKKTSTTETTVVKPSKARAAAMEKLKVAKIWNVKRSLTTPMAFADWRLRPVKETAIMFKRLVECVENIGNGNTRVAFDILAEMSLDLPDLCASLPRVSALLSSSSSKNGGHAAAAAVGADLSELIQTAANGLSLPNMGHSILLPSGNPILSETSSRRTRVKTYHPSWAWRGKGESDGLGFESCLRYLSCVTPIQQTTDLKAALMSIQKRPISIFPSELTRIRFTKLANDYFAGRETLLLKMFDQFFQGAMGNVSSGNSKLVDGGAVLYKFPLNGFASMVTTGAKGSDVNFAMICGMLSQQSLEGKRVPLMVSGKTHPAFAKYDLAARAGGLITDRYLSGLRPADYFFHCMAGREGLVDTAVKTARSGYLQRCVMKSTEGIVIQNDGTTRESDGTILQFQYGEDGIDVTRALYLTRFADLVTNPTLLYARFLHPSRMQNKWLLASIRTVRQIEAKRLKNQQIREKEIKEETEEVKLEDDNQTSSVSTPEILDPITTVCPPMSYPTSTSEKYMEVARGQIKKILDDKRLVRILRNSPVGDSIKKLELIARLKYTDCLAPAGDSVGCLAAQSMGEPATQMTLNTFHLAGHGAANVTLGIPRLREILQCAGDTKTPVLYLALKECEEAEQLKNAHTLLLGFRKIHLTDIVNSLGVEANVCYQVRNRQIPSNAGCGEYRSKVADDEEERSVKVRKYWMYDVTIQMENLDHFCSVANKYTPQKLINFVMNRVVREMLKTSTKLMAVTAAKTCEEVIDSEDDELEVAADRIVFERHIQRATDRKKAQMGIYKAAGLGFGASGGPAGGRRRGGEDDDDADDEGGAVVRGDMDFSTSANVEEVTVQKKQQHLDDDDDAEDAGARFKRSSKLAKKEADDEEGMSDSGEETDDSRDARISGSSEEGDDDEGVLDAESQQEKQEELEDDDREKRASTTTSTYEQVSQPSEANQWEFDRKRKRLLASSLAQLKPDPVEDEAIWSDCDGPSFRSRPFPDDAFRYLTDLKVDNKSYKINFRFGWPYERCPRKVEFLKPFTRIIRKQLLQATPGINNPRLVGDPDGKTTETKAKVEIQCEGSNFEWASRLSNTMIDHNKTRSNDLRAIIAFYGIEAGRACIISELARVFGAYGIDVNFRHLSLIADTMTSSGYFRAFSRMGVSYHPSPFLKMSFETSMKFLSDSVERYAQDNLKCPAGAIVIGRATWVGTGLSKAMPNVSLKLRDKSEAMMKKQKKRRLSSTSTTNRMKKRMHSRTTG